MIPLSTRRAGRTIVAAGAALAIFGTACAAPRPASGNDAANSPGDAATAPDRAASASDQATTPTDHPSTMHESTNGTAHTGHDHAEHGAALALVDLAAVTHVAESSGAWTSPSTWSGGDVPADGSRVHVPDGVAVTIDGVVPGDVKTVRVDGVLSFEPTVDTELRVDTLVTTPTGALEIGRAGAPVASDVTARVVFADDGPIDRQWDPELVSRGAILHGST
ncbi:MAG: G8 domain-containing protein, partial [Actinomycetota bacterium]